MQFEQTALSREMQRAIQDMGFTEMTEVQEKTIPKMMEGKDVIAKAPTGTGKTCAFGVPIIERIDGESDALQCLILAPTREQRICGQWQSIKRGSALSACTAGNPCSAR